MIAKIFVFVRNRVVRRIMPAIKEGAGRVRDYIRINMLKKY